MGWLWDELIARAGPDSESEVNAAVKRWRTRIGPIMRELTALKLTAEHDRASIVIHVKPGLPIALQQLDLKVNEAGEFLLGIFQNSLSLLNLVIRSLNYYSSLISMEIHGVKLPKRIFKPSNKPLI